MGGKRMLQLCFLVLGLGLVLCLVLGLGWIKKDLDCRQRFLKEYPSVKQELEECIAQLWAVEDKVDKVHKDCTISKVVASSIGIVSKVLTIAGLVLAPVTARASLVLTIIGVVFGIISGIASVTTDIVEHSSMPSTEAETKCLSSSDMNREKEMMDFSRSSAPKMINLGYTVMNGVNNVKKNTQAYKLLKDSSSLAAANDKQQFMTVGGISASNGKQVDKAFEGTALVMTKEARLKDIAYTGISILIDAYNFLQQSKQLYEGEKTESAEQLRQQAQELETKLEQLKQIHDSLQQGLSLWPWEWHREEECMVIKLEELTCKRDKRG